MSLDQIAYTLGAITATGGTIGFVKTGSIPSVVAGVSVGALYGLSAYRLQNNQPYAIELGLLASFVLAGSSIPRAIRSQKPLPSALSVLALVGLYKFGVAWNAKL